MTLTGFTLNTELSAENQDQSPSLLGLSALAKQNKIALVAGKVMSSADKAENTLIAFSDNGAEQARYVKINPFSFAVCPKFY